MGKVYNLEPFPRGLWVINVILKDIVIILFYYVNKMATLNFWSGDSGKKWTW